MNDKGESYIASLHPKEGIEGRKGMEKCCNYIIITDKIMNDCTNKSTNGMTANWIKNNYCKIKYQL